jgi:hypothetical protein
MGFITVGLLLVRGRRDAISCLVSSSSRRGIPVGDVWASTKSVQRSLQKVAASSSPKNPAKFNWARLGSTRGGTTGASNAGFVVGRNRLMAVDATISSSKPRISVILRSIHWDMTGMLILERLMSVL